jgi:hypothetical protein
MRFLINGPSGGAPFVILGSTGVRARFVRPRVSVNVRTHRQIVPRRYRGLAVDFRVIGTVVFGFWRWHFRFGVEVHTDSGQAGS